MRVNRLNPVQKAKEREEQAQLERTASGVNQYYGIGAVIAVGVIDSLGYYIYWSKKGELPNDPPQGPRPQTNKFEMD